VFAVGNFYHGSKHPASKQALLTVMPRRVTLTTATLLNIPIFNSSDFKLQWTDKFWLEKQSPFNTRINMLNSSFEEILKL